MPSNTPLNAHFLPWLELKEEVTLNQFKFWPFRKFANQKIQDRAIRDHLESVFATYVQPRPLPSHKGETIPIGEVTLVTGDTYDLTANMHEGLLNQAKNALAFACIDGNGEWNWCTSDNFELIQLRFSPGDPNIGYQAGEIGRIKSFGWQLGEVLFQVPIYVNNHYVGKYDAELLSALSFVLRDPDRTESQTILRALEYFTQACRNSGDIGREMRVILMALGFEILLELCDRNPRKDFRSKIQSVCGEGSEPTQPYEILNERTGRVIGTEQLTHKQIWAEEFYKLRNRIVHGWQLNESDFVFYGQSHFRIAELFFRVSVRRRLEGMSGSGYKSTSGITRNSKGEFEFDFWAV